MAFRAMVVMVKGFDLVWSSALRVAAPVSPVAPKRVIGIGVVMVKYATLNVNNVLVKRSDLLLSIRG